MLTFDAGEVKSFKPIETGSKVLTAAGPVKVTTGPSKKSLSVSFTYESPKIFTGAITLRLLKRTKISATRPWQIENNLTGRVDLNGNTVLSGSYRAYHLGGADNMLTATGSLTFFPFSSPDFGFSGLMTGTIAIPTPGPEVLALPFIGNSLRFLRLMGVLPATLGIGTAAIVLSAEQGTKVSASMDVRQNPIPAIRLLGRLSVEYTDINGEQNFTARQERLPGSGGALVHYDNRCINNHEQKQVYVVALDQEGVRSCGTQAISITTSVQDRDVRYSSVAGEMIVSPNPTTGVFSVRFVGEGRASSSLELYDLMGVLVLSVNVPDKSDTGFSLAVDASALSPGSYVARVRTDAGIAIGRIAVVR